MSIEEYILQELKAFDVTEAQLLNMSLNGGYWLNDEYSMDVMKPVGLSIVGFIEKMVFSPKVANVNEGGFSMSWDYGDLGKYYLWLCNKWNITPNSDVMGHLGISIIKDKTDSW